MVRERGDGFPRGRGAHGEKAVVVACVCLAGMGSLRIKGRFG